MTFNDKNPLALRVTLTYNLLQNFTRQLNMPFQKVPNEVNLIILRGAKPISPETQTVVDTREEVLEQVEWNTDPNNTPVIQIVDDKLGEYNDTVIIAWVDEEGREFVKAVLGSADPGVYWIKRKSKAGSTTGSLGPGHHIAVWRMHKGRYEALSLLDDEDASGKIEPDEIDHVTPGRRIVKIDKEGNVLEYRYGTVSGEHIHGGGWPTADKPDDDEVYNWSEACVVICGAESGKKPGPVFEAFRKWLEVEGPRKDERGNLNSQARFNTVVWNAWSLYLYTKKLFKGNFRPVIEFGARDLPKEVADERMPRWVTRMQESLNKKSKVINPWIDYLKDRNPKYKDELKPMEGFKPDGKFGGDTAVALRSFQLASYLIIKNSILMTQKDKTIAEEVLWERSKWICGPETWLLLDAIQFDWVLSLERWIRGIKE
jgi:hypothetical protein